MRNPFVLLVLNFIVGYAVANGWVNPDLHDELVNQLADVVGLGIIFATSIVSLWKVLKHVHVDVPHRPIGDTTITTVTKQITTIPPVEDFGTPPPASVSQ